MVPAGHTFEPTHVAGGPSAPPSRGVPPPIPWPAVPFAPAAPASPPAPPAPAAPPTPPRPAAALPALPPLPPSLS